MRMQDGWQSPAPYATPARFHVERNLAMLLAQLLAVVQGILGVISGFNTIRLASAFNALSQLGAPIPNNNELVIDGVIIIAISLLVILAGFLVGRGSPALRYLLVAWEVIALIFTVSVLVVFVPVLQLRDVFLILASGAGMDFVHPWIALAIEAAIIYGLVIHPPSRAAFAQ